MLNVNAMGVWDLTGDNSVLDCRSPVVSIPFASLA